MTLEPSDSSRPASGLFRWRDVVGVVLLALFSGGLGIWVRTPCAEKPPAVSGVAHPALSLEQFKAYVEEKKVLILDAREAGVFREGHVPGALSLPVSDFDQAYQAMKPLLAPHQERLVIVYCSDMWCGQADALQQKLINYGFRHVGRFPDGWGAWMSAHLPVEK